MEPRGASSEVEGVLLGVCSFRSLPQPSPPGSKPRKVNYEDLVLRYQTHFQHNLFALPCQPSTFPEIWSLRRLGWRMFQMCSEQKPQLGLHRVPPLSLLLGSPSEMGAG